MRVLKPYIKGLPIILLMMALSYMLAKVYLSYAVPQYEGVAKILLSDTRQGIANGNLYKNLDIFSSIDVVPAEAEVIQSASLLEQVIDWLNLQTEIYRVQHLKKKELYSDSPIHILMYDLDKSDWNEPFDVYVNADSTIRIKSTATGKTADGKVGQIITCGNSKMFIGLNESAFQKYPDIDLEGHYRVKIYSREAIFSLVRDHLYVLVNDKEVPVILISYKSPNAEKAMWFPNKLAEIYISDYINTRRGDADKTLSFLSERIDEVSQNLIQSELEILKYRQKHGIINIAQETETDLKKVADMKVQLTNLKMSLDAITELERHLKTGNYDLSKLAPDFQSFNSSLSTGIVATIQQLESAKKDLLLFYTADEGKVKVIDDKIRDMSAYLMESVVNTRKDLEYRCKRMEEDITNAETVFSPIPEDERQMTVLGRKFQMYQQSHKFLSDKKIEAEIAYAANLSFHRIITKAELSNEPVSPNVSILSLVAALLGMIVSIIGIALVHTLKGKVNCREEVEENSKLSLAATVPYLSKGADIQNFYLKLVSQLQVKQLIQPNSVIGINGYRQNEGMRFNAWHIAQALTNQGLRVLLIDISDAFKGKESKYFNVGNRQFTLMPMDYEVLKYYSQEKLSHMMETYKSEYDVVVVLNDVVGGLLSVGLMAVSDVNFICLDTLKTPAKRIVETDILKDEYGITNLHFILNREHYSPSIFQEMKMWMQGIGLWRKK